MLKDYFVKYSLKIISAIVSFCLIICFIQPFFVPKYLSSSTTIVKGYSYLEDNSLEVLFLGASQMFCSVDSGKLTNEHDIVSYDFGASAQFISMTPYYLREALKTQKPKLIMVEICRIFSANKEIPEHALAWNYNPPPASVSKYQSLYSILNGDIVKAFEYSFVPLLLYHNRWSSLNNKEYDGQNDIDYVIHPEKYIDFSARGFVARNHTEKVSIVYYNQNYNRKDIPVENIEAIKEIEKICMNNNINLVFFKSPVANWTRGESLSVKHFMDENGLKYIDLNDSINEIGINADTDFFNSDHLNTIGAEKTTNYLAKIIPQYIQ